MAKRSNSTWGYMENGNCSEFETLTVQVLNELPDIIAISSEWDSLVNRSSCNRAFSSSRWFIASCRNDPAMRPYVIIARRGKAIAGILPLVLTEHGQVARFPNYLSDYSDIIAAPDDFRVVSRLLHFARSVPDGYKTIVLSNLRRDSNCLRAMRIQEPHGPVDNSFEEIVRCYNLRLPANYDDFLRTRSSRFRKRVKRLQRLADAADLTVCELEPDTFPSDRLPDVFLPLHLDRRTTNSCFESTSAQSFVEEVIPYLFEKRAIRACAVFQRDRMVAIDLYTMGSNSLCAWNGGFLAEIEHCSPGKLLINAGIKMACELRLEEYDFMRGIEAYKSYWSNTHRSIGQVKISAAARLPGQP